MAISTKTRLAIARRLSADSEWAESETGKLGKLLVDTDCVSLATVAKLFDKHPAVILRWFVKFKRPGLTRDEKATNEKHIAVLRKAIVRALEDGKIPATQDIIYSLLKKQFKED